jgi:GNAT superfamily N-acetyltransferase
MENAIAPAEAVPNPLLVRLLDAPEVARFVPLTFPALRGRLGTGESNSNLFAVGAALLGEPVGLALAEIAPGGASAQLLSLFVVAPYRRRGLGTTLLAELEATLAQRGCIRMSAAYRDALPGLTGLEGVLRKRFWTPPQPDLHLFTFDRGLLDASWIKQGTLPSDFILFAWNELTPRERAELEARQGTDSWHDESLSPFTEEERIDGNSSLGLRRNGQVVGWVVTHRLPAGPVRWSSLFVRRDLQGTGRAIPMLAESIRRHCAAHPDVPMICFVSPENTVMLRFAERRLVPYAVSHSETRVSHCLLQTGGGTRP